MIHMRTLFAVLSFLSLSAGAARADGFDLAAELATGTPMTAQLAATRALEASPQMERAEALARAAEALVSRLRVQLLPRLDASARYLHIDGFPDGRISLAGDPAAREAARALATQVADPSARALWLGSLEQQAAGQRIQIPRDQYALSARLSYPVSDVVFAALPAIEGAKAAAEAAHAQQRAEAARVALSARETFYQVARARGARAVAARAVEQARALRDSIDAAVRAGIRAPADGSSAAARLAASEQGLVAAEAAVDVADAALRTLLQDGEGALYAVSEPLRVDATDTVAPASAELLIGKARAQRAEVLALQRAIEGQRTSARAQLASGYPHLSVYAGADYARPNRYMIPPRAAFQSSWEVGAALTYAPHDTLRARRQHREDSARIAASEADLEALDRALILEVRTARATLARSEQNLAATQAATLAAEAAYERRRAELLGGTATLADLFTSEGELNSARLAALDALIDDRVARARLAYAVGD
jgi:outer membrane protein TolC